MKMNNKRYIVTKGSDCGTLLKGDHIRIYDDGTVLCVEAGGWLNKEDSAVVLETVEFEIDREYYQKQRDKIERMLK